MRRRIWVLGLLVVLGAGAATYFATATTGPARELSLAGDAARGTYLMALGGCVACHTDSKGGRAQLAGGPALVSPFGTFYAPNITSDTTAGIGGWSLAQFSRAMSDGEGPQGHLYPAFPYESYTLMSDQEIADLFAALQAAPADPTPSRPHDLGFPFNVRVGLAAWKALFFRPQRYVAEPTRSEQWNRGRYLATGPGHCVMCHSPRNLLGAVEPGKLFSGNKAGGPGGRAPSLLAADLVAEGYDRALLAQTLADGFTPGFDVLGGAMGEVIRDGTSRWTPADRDAIAAYLLEQD